MYLFVKKKKTTKKPTHTQKKILPVYQSYTIRNINIKNIWLFCDPNLTWILHFIIEIKKYRMPIFHSANRTISIGTTRFFSEGQGGGLSW